VAGLQPYVLTEETHGGTHARKTLDKAPPPIVLDLCSRMAHSGCCSVNEAWHRLLMVGVVVELDVVRKTFVRLNERFTGEAEY
jgi:hypothetical protein